MVDFYSTDYPPCFPFVLQCRNMKITPVELLSQVQNSSFTKGVVVQFGQCVGLQQCRYLPPKLVYSYYKKQLSEQMSFILLPVLSNEFKRLLQTRHKRSKSYLYSTKVCWDFMFKHPFCRPSDQVVEFMMSIFKITLPCRCTLG